MALPIRVRVSVRFRVRSSVMVKIRDRVRFLATLGHMARRVAVAVWRRVMDCNQTAVDPRLPKPSLQSRKVLLEAPSAAAVLGNRSPVTDCLPSEPAGRGPVW